MSVGACGRVAQLKERDWDVGTAGDVVALAAVVVAVRGWVCGLQQLCRHRDGRENMKDGRRT